MGTSSRARKEVDSASYKTPRQRPVSCYFCRSRKLRCSRDTPCSNCAVRKIQCLLYREDGSLAASTPLSPSTSETPVTFNQAQLVDQDCSTTNVASSEILQRLKRLEDLVSGGPATSRGDEPDHHDHGRVIRRSFHETISTQLPENPCQIQSGSPCSPLISGDVRSLEMVSRGVGVTVFHDSRCSH